jgi:DNA-binding phage protein
MALTRDFKATVTARMQSDPDFARAMFGEAITLFVDGEPDTAKRVLRDLVNATVGFERLAQEIGRPVKSLHRMLSSTGNPTLSNISMIVSAIKRVLGLEVSLLGVVRERPERTVRLSIDSDEPVGRINPDAVDTTTEEEIARQKAQDDLADQRYFLLSKEKYEQFLKLLDRPAQSNPGLERLFSRKAPWERLGDDN